SYRHMATGKMILNIRQFQKKDTLLSATSVGTTVFNVREPAGAENQKHLTLHQHSPCPYLRFSSPDKNPGNSHSRKGHPNPHQVRRGIAETGHQGQASEKGTQGVSYIESGLDNGRGYHL